MIFLMSLRIWFDSEIVISKLTSLFKIELSILKINKIKSKEYQLSEILYEVTSKIQIEEKYNEVIKSINEIHKKKIVFDNDIIEFEEEEKLLEEDIKILNDRLNNVKQVLISKRTERDFYNKRIVDTETAYEKICSSTTLLLNAININH